MAVEYPASIPDLLTRFGINPVDFTSYTDFLRELQALLDAAGTNPQGANGTIANRLTAIEEELASPALFVTTADSGTISNTLTETAFSNGRVTIPAGAAIIGRTYRISAGGKLSTMASAPGTLTWRIRWGNLITDPLVLTFAAGNQQAGLGNAPWIMSCLATIRTVGVAGSIMAIGGYGAASAPVTINTTVSKDLTLTTQWSVANAANLITLQAFVVEQVN